MAIKNKMKKNNNLWSSWIYKEQELKYNTFGKINQKNIKFINLETLRFNDYGLCKEVFK